MNTTRYEMGVGDLVEMIFGGASEIAEIRRRYNVLGGEFLDVRILDSPFNVRIGRTILVHEDEIKSSYLRMRLLDDYG